MEKILSETFEKEKMNMSESRSIGPEKRWIVLFRDNFTCQRCGKKGTFRLTPWGREHPLGKFCANLEVHHIHGPISDDYDNLITLCSECHLAVHAGSWKNKPIEIFTPNPISEEIIRKAIEDYNNRIQGWIEYLAKYASEIVGQEEDIIA